MFDYLSPYDGPVVRHLEQHETVYAKNQPQYRPLRTLPGENGNSAISRFHLTAWQRKAIADGADIYLEILHYGGPLAPSRLMVMDQPENPNDGFLGWWISQSKAPYTLGRAAAVRPIPQTDSISTAADDDLGVIVAAAVDTSSISDSFSPCDSSSSSIDSGSCDNGGGDSF